MKSNWIVFVLILILSFACQQETKETVAAKDQLILEEPYAIGTPENPWARLDYEQAIVNNPRTGKPNPGQRQKELQFVKKMKRGSLRQSNETESWSLAGPINVGGRTRALGVDVLDESTLIAGGVSGGIWKSENFGQSWRRTSDPSMLNSITTLVQDRRPGHENEWYYGSGELRGNSARGGGAPFRGDGIFKSVDNGETWTSLNATSLFGINAEFISQFQFVWNLAINESRTDVDEILAATFGGIVRSIDGGETWNVVLGEDLINPGTDINQLEAPFYTDVAITPGGRYFATIGSLTIPGEVYEPSGIFTSEDGVNWSEIGPSGLLSQLDRTVIGISPSNENIIYFLVDERMDNDEPQLWRLEISETSPPIWTNLSNNIPVFDVTRGEFDTQDSYNMVLAVDPRDESIVYIGAANLYRSTDGFTSTDNTTWIGGYTPEGTGAIFDNHHPDQHVIKFVSNNPNLLLSGNDGGIFFTQNNLAPEVEWTSLNEGYITSQFYSVTQQQDEANGLIMGGLQDNGTYIRSGTADEDWLQLLGGDGGFAYITRERRSFYLSVQLGRMFRFEVDDELNRLSFARIDPVGGGDGFIGYLFINPYVIDPEQESIMYLAGGDRIWRNDNLEQVPLGSNSPTTANWTELENTVTVEVSGGQITRADGQVTALDIAKGDVETLYYGTSSGRLFAIENPQIDGSAVNDITPEIFPQGAFIMNITVNQDNPDELIVVFSSHLVRSIFRSSDGGQTFSDISGNLEEDLLGLGGGPSVRWSEVVPLADGSNKYFVGTSAGVFSTRDVNTANVIWEQEGPEIIGNSVIRQLDYRPLDGRLVVATHGNGVFETFIANQKVPEGLTETPDFAVENVFPNPLGSDSERMRIVYTLPQTSTVRVDIFNAAGQLVDVVFFGEQARGTNQIFWNGTNSAGHQVENGTYFYNIRFNGDKIGGAIVINR